MFLINIYYILFELPDILLSKYVAPKFVIKLNLKHKIFSFELLFSINESTIDFKPLSLILLWPISKNYKLGEFFTIFSETAFAPSYPILLLKRFKYFNDLLSFKETDN